jgi:hypothetical protein
MVDELIFPFFSKFGKKSLYEAVEIIVSKFLSQINCSMQPDILNAMFEIKQELLIFELWDKNSRSLVFHLQRGIMQYVMTIHKSKG